MHVVVDVYCIGCLHLVGWRYEEAFDKSQKYKVRLPPWAFFQLWACLAACTSPEVPHPLSCS